jgi:hypothetical protein
MVEPHAPTTRRTKHELREVRPGRFLGDIDIWLQGPGEEDRGPRYTLSVVDIVPPSQTPLPCAVFIIPQGREHEWLFSTPDGLRAVAGSAEYRRMICVRMNRGHTFADMEQVRPAPSLASRGLVPHTQHPRVFCTDEDGGIVLSRHGSFDSAINR